MNKEEYSAYRDDCQMDFEERQHNLYKDLANELNKLYKSFQVTQCDACHHFREKHFEADGCSDCKCEKFTERE